MGKTGAPWTTGGVLDSVGQLVRTTAYVLCAGTLCLPCVAPCSSKSDSLDDGAGSLPAEHYGDGTEAGQAGLGLMKLAPNHSVSRPAGAHHQFESDWMHESAR